MNVKVARHTSSGWSTEVHPYVNPLWLKHFLDNRDRASSFEHHLAVDVLSQFLDIADMLVRHYHQVPRSVWIAVHDYESVVATMQDQVVFVSFFLYYPAEKTALFLVRLGRKEVLFPPWCVYILHHAAILSDTIQNATQFLNLRTLITEHAQ